MNAVLPSQTRDARDRKARAIRKLLMDHIEEPEHGCSCGAKRPAYRASAAWWVQHIADLIASAA